MKRKVVTGIVLTLLLIGVLMLVLDIQTIKGSETIYIRADGSIDPPTASITTVDNVAYTFTDDIHDSIVVERDNITIDGNDYTIQPNQTQDIGLDLSYRSDVIVKNTKVTGFERGIYLYISMNNTLYRNTLSNNHYGIYLKFSIGNTISENIVNSSQIGVYLEISSSNTISENAAVDNSDDGIQLQSLSNHNTIVGNTITKKGEESEHGIYLYNSRNNTIVGNTVSNAHGAIQISSSSNYNSICGNTVYDNTRGIYLTESSNNIVCGNEAKFNRKGVQYDYATSNEFYHNTIKNNEDYGFVVHNSDNNTFHHNNFIDNLPAQGSTISINTWDDGAEGNYWSDYTGTDMNGDGIGDEPYNITEKNQDNYPLMNVYNGEEAPVARLSAFPTTVLADSEYVRFDASASYDPDCCIVSYFYDYGDGFNSGWVSGSVHYRSYLEPGEYYARVKVKDNDGLESDWSDSIEITVTLSTNPPVPTLISIDYPNSINLGEWATTTIKARNDGDKANEMYISVSLPDNPPMENIEIVSHDLQDAYILPVGAEVWGDYGTTYPVVLDHPLVEGFKENWENGETKTLQFKVKPQNPGTFCFFVKTTAQVDGLWSYDPQSGTKDQQNEYVYVHEIDVQPSHMDLIEEYLPYLVFDEEEQFYPTDFLYDDADITNNPSNYDKDAWPNTAYVHTVQGYWDQKEYLVIEYWFYYARDNKLWGIEFPWIGPHDHDWESIYLFLEKEGDGYVPSKIAYFKHKYLVGLDLEEYYNIYGWQQTSLIPPFEKKDETHPIVHVAVDSHGSYERSLLAYGWPIYYAPSGDQGIPYPEPVDGGREMDQSDFEIIFASTPNPSWPSEWFGNINAPWAIPRWDDPWYLLVPRPVKNSLSIVVGSPVDILTIDPQDRRIGYDSETGTAVNEIPEATYSGLGSQPQIITIPSPIPGGYSIYSFGTGTGNYTIIIESIATNGTIIGTLTLNNTASQGKLDTYSIELKEDYTVIPEFSLFTILPLFMITTLLIVIIHKRKHTIHACD